MSIANGTLVFVLRPAPGAVVFDPATVTGDLGANTDGSEKVTAVAFLGTEHTNRLTPTLVTANIYTSRSAAASSRLDRAGSLTLVGSTV